MKLPTNRQNIITGLLLGYLLIIIIFMLVKNISITPDRLFLYLLFAAVIAGRAWTFIKDWVPFLALLLGYEMLRGFADNFFSVAVEGLVKTEKILFGGYLPTEVLQNIFYKPGYIGPIDILGTAFYFMHFPLPLVVAFYFWMKDKSRYYKFVIALLLLSFAGFITFLLFPAAPPWYASQEGIISVIKINQLVVDHFGWQWDLSYYYQRLNPNPVAAMPSLHAAYPTLVLLALRNYKKKLFWFFLPYPIIVGFSTVYLGEHYVIDVIAGVFYTVIAYHIVYNFGKVKVLVFTKLAQTFPIFGKQV